MVNWKDKKVLITGANGLVGRELIFQLLERGAKVRATDLNIKPLLGVECVKADLTYKSACEQIVKDMDYVFNCVGIKGNPKMTNEQPLDFFVPMIQFNTNMIEASRRAKVKRFCYVSSIAVENMESDFYPAWAKMTGEHQIHALRKQDPEMKCCIVRPANVYGRFDNPNKEHCMVVTDLIRKARKEDKLLIWGDGTSERDFINSIDCARGMIEAMEQLPTEDGKIKPVNLCSGYGVQIGQVAKTIAEYYNKELEFDLTKPTGAKRRVMALNWKFEPKIDIADGLMEVCKYAEKW